MRRPLGHRFWLPLLLLACQPAGLDPAAARPALAPAGQALSAITWSGVARSAVDLSGAPTSALSQPKVSQSRVGQSKLGPFVVAQAAEAAEEANCAKVSGMVEANAAPVQRELERLARQRFGRGFAELTPEQIIQLSSQVTVTGRQATAEQERLARRCDAYQQRQIALQSAMAGLDSLGQSNYYLVRWGREQVAGLGCSCFEFQLGGEDHDHGCPGTPDCPGQRGGPRSPDPRRGCASLGAAAWINRQLPGMYGLLGLGQESEAMRNAVFHSNRSDPAPGCEPLPVPAAAPVPPAAPCGPVPAGARGPGAVAPAAIAAGAACFANPEAAGCQRALLLGDGLVRAAQRASRQRCLGYALVARSLWALGADPAFTDLLISFPAASRLRNEAGIALRYLRSDCRGL